MQFGNGDPRKAGVGWKRRCWVAAALVKEVVAAEPKKTAHFIIIIIFLVEWVNLVES